MFTTSYTAKEIETITAGDVVYLQNAQLGGEYPVKVTRTTASTVTVDHYGETRRFTMKGDALWNGQDYLLLAA